MPPVSTACLINSPSDAATASPSPCFPVSLSPCSLVSVPLCPPGAASYIFRNLKSHGPIYSVLLCVQCEVREADQNANINENRTARRAAVGDGLDNASTGFRWNRHWSATSAQGCCSCAGKTRS
jgi:hypothetical protein